MGKPSTLFWLVALGSLAANGLIAVDSWLASSGQGELLGLYTNEFVDWVRTRPEWRIGLQLTGAISGLIGSLLLVLRRREATAILSFALILTTLALAGDVLVLGGLKYAQMTDLVSSAMLIAVSGAFAWYADRAASLSWLR